MGSSAKSIAGSLTNALAMATLCLCPPESSFGLCFTRFPSPTFSNAAIAFCCLNFLGTLAYTIGNSTFSNEESFGNKLND